MTLQSGSSNLKAILTLIRRNDELLQSKIRSLPACFGLQDDYQNAILSYYDQVGKIKGDDYTSERSKVITNIMKDIWIKNHGKIETTKLFANFEAFEKFLFKMKQYRGHYIHQFNVFILGFYILSRLLESNTVDEEIRKTNDNPHFTWMICSTIHDIGYPIQTVESWFQDFLEGFLGSITNFQINIRDILTPTYPNYIEDIAEMHYQLTNLHQNQWHYRELMPKDMQFEELLLRKLGRKDHGVISAIAVAYSILIKETGLNTSDLMNRDYPFYILPACHAISIHNLEPDDLQIEFETLPFAFLLALCDELQDWGRSLDGNDKSDLTGVDIRMGDIPEITFSVKMLDSSKKNAFEALRKRLKCKLIRVVINAEDIDGIYNYVINDSPERELSRTSQV